MLKEFHKYIKEYWAVAELHKGLFVFSLFTAALYKALSIARPFVAALIIEALIKQNQAETYRYILIFALVYLAYRLTLFLNWRAYSWNLAYSYRRIHNKIFQKLTSVDQDFTRAIPKGFFLNTINSDIIAVSEMADELSEFFLTPFQTLFIFILVARYSWIYPVLFIVANLAYEYSRNFFDRRYNHFWQKTRREDDNYATFLNEVASGLQEVKTFNLLPKLYQRLGKIQTRYNKFYQIQRRQKTYCDVHANYIFYGFKILLYFILITGFFNGYLEISVIVLIISYYDSAGSSIDDFIDACIDIRLTNASVRHIRTVYEYHPEKPFEFGNTSIDNLSGHIRFKNVSLKLDNKPILKNLNLDIKPRETIAIVGFPGAGKTMLFNVLLRLRQPDKGQIFLDDIDIRDFTKEIYTSSVAVANQTPFIFNTSIKNNLDLVDTDTKKQIKACKIAGIHDFIETLPMGYNTILRENATNVSGGQKQMISIARTVLTNAEVILLDDVTTSLDPNTAKLVPALLKRLEKNHTVLMITKKPELMRAADRIVVLDHGKIEAVGTHSALMKSSKVYRTLQQPSSSQEAKNV